MSRSVDGAPFCYFAIENLGVTILHALSRHDLVLRRPLNFCSGEDGIPGKLRPLLIAVTDD
jgi:hypothetical protein